MEISSFSGVVHLGRRNSTSIPLNVHDARTHRKAGDKSLRVDCEVVQVRGGTHFSADSLTAVLLGSPDWTDATLATIAREQNPAAAAVAGYQRSGSGVLDALTGEYAVFLADTVNERYLLATDRLGRFPVYYALHDGALIFGSTATAIRAANRDAFSVLPQSLYDYVYFHMVPAPASIFNGIFKLQAAQCLEVHSPDKHKVSTYWLPDFNEYNHENEADLHAGLIHVVQEAVAGRVNNVQVGAFLSGGLDSSTVAGMLARSRPDKARTYSIGFSAEGYDEIEYARAAVKHFGLTSREYYVTPADVANTIPIIAAAYDEPFGNSSAVPAFLCAQRAAEDGIEVMLAGDGGDELFAGNARYAKQAIFELYQHIPRMLRMGMIEPAGLHLPATIPLVSKLRSYIEQARIPLPDRLQTYNYLHRHDPEQIFTEDFLTQVDTDAPLRLQREIYHRPPNASSLNRMLYLDWQQTLADNDLRKVGQMCALAGVQVTYPLLDDRVVEFSCRIPSRMKLPGGKLRQFYKDAMAGFLPEKIIRKRKHGFGLPFGVWMQTDPTLQTQARSALHDLRRRGIFRDAFLDQLLAWHRDVHAVYYGELVWVLTMLELWLQTNC